MQHALSFVAQQSGISVTEISVFAISDKPEKTSVTWTSQSLLNNILTPSKTSVSLDSKIHGEPSIYGLW